MIRLDLLTKIADELENFVPDLLHGFDMSRWVCPVDKDGQLITGWMDVKEDVNNVCGTVCCAVGLGIQRIPEFRDELRRLGDFTVTRLPNDVFYFRGTFLNVADALGIGTDDAEFLFNPDRYEGPSNRDENDKVRQSVVVARIRNFVKSHQTHPAIIRGE